MQTAYVSPGGNAVSSGALDDPGDLAEILKPATVRPGSTIYLRGGTYSGNYTCALSGAEGKKTVIRSYPGENVVIDGSLTITGNHIRLIGSD